MFAFPTGVRGCARITQMVQQTVKQLLICLLCEDVTLLELQFHYSVDGVCTDYPPPGKGHAVETLSLVSCKRRSAIGHGLMISSVSAGGR